MTRKAIIIALVITGIYMVLGQAFIIGEFRAFIEASNQPDWALNATNLIAAQLGLYFALGYIIYRNMVIHRLMVKPSIFLLIITFSFWEVFKIAVFDWQLPFLAFFLLLCYLILLLLLNLFLFREDGLSGIVCVPITLFSVLYVAPWFYQVMTLNLEQTQ